MTNEFRPATIAFSLSTSSILALDVEARAPAATFSSMTVKPIPVNVARPSPPQNALEAVRRRSHHGKEAVKNLAASRRGYRFLGYDSGPSSSSRPWRSSDLFESDGSCGQINVLVHWFAMNFGARFVNDDD
jgi:hypothetical protein